MSKMMGVSGAKPLQQRGTLLKAALSAAKIQWAARNDAEKRASEYKARADKAEAALKECLEELENYKSYLRESDRKLKRAENIVGQLRDQQSKVLAQQQILQNTIDEKNIALDACNDLLPGTNP